MSKRFPDVDWYCDRCGEHLNDQAGFDDHRYSWKCEQCGHKNSISKDNIYESHEDFHDGDYDEIRSMKRADSYRFTYPIEYIIDRIGDENSNEYVIGNTTIDVQFDWYDGDDRQAPGYRLSYVVNNYDQIPVGFNGSQADLLDQIYPDIQSDLRASGIEVGAVEPWF